MTKINSDLKTIRPADMNLIKPAGLYIHIPFCERKCHYCDFLSFADCTETVKKQYISALIAEMRRYTGKADTLFIGGGTPSLLGQEEIAAIIAAANSAFSVDPNAERTIEVNPGTVTGEKMQSYLDIGINRLSIGVQTLNDQMLSSLGRIHSKEDFLRNYHLARETGFQNINIDLMFGIPGQTMGIWSKTLKEAITLRPEHISFYSLQLEEGTPFYQQYKAGTLNLASDKEERNMYHYAIKVLKEAGYHHYEISNCALPGYECRHNLKYWSFIEYYGIGLGAHSFQYEGGRLANTGNLDVYMRGTLPESAHISLGEAMGEYVFTGLRKMEGIDTDHFRRFFKRDFYRVYEPVIDKIKEYESEGLLKISGSQIALTEQGIDRSNEILSEFI